MLSSWTAIEKKRRAKTASRSGIRLSQLSQLSLPPGFPSTASLGNVVETSSVVTTGLAITVRLLIE